MSSKIFQNIITQLSGVFSCTVGVADETCSIVACTEPQMVGGHINSDVVIASPGMGLVFSKNSYTYIVMGQKNKMEYVIFAQNEDEMSAKYCKILAANFSNIKELFDERYDKASFIKNIILDNVLPSDVRYKAKELGIATDADRVAYLIRMKDNTELAAFDIVQNLFPQKNKDFVISVNENEIVLIKEVKPNTETKDLNKTALNMLDTLNAEGMVKAVIGIGTPMGNINELARSYKEAQVAIEVGKVFDTDKSIINYEALGMGRLVYQLPTRLCEMFLSEIFKKEPIDVLDAETILTIQMFFQNNLNVSETSRQLYVHRNTLVYRLDKVEKLTGLDLRVFENAIVFKFAMMVKKYLMTNPIKI